MKIMIKKALIVAGIMLLFNTTIYADDCNLKWCQSSKLTQVEKLICSDKSLRSADVLMSQIYTEIMGYKGKEGYEGMWYREVQSDQKDWLAKRNEAKSKSQILESYMSRIQELYTYFKGFG